LRDIVFRLCVGAGLLLALVYGVHHAPKPSSCPPQHGIHHGATVGQCINKGLGQVLGQWALIIAGGAIVEWARFRGQFWALVARSDSLS
jgi:hypothetical protein